jgi:N-dimethylarginine dimethylaminohydrolase
MDTAQSEVGALSRVVLKHARDAFVDDRTIAEQWRALNFTAPPGYAKAVREYDRFVELLRECGTSVDFLPASSGTGMDSIYVRDASVVSDRGVILCRMGKALRQGEPAAQEAAFRSMGYPVIGSIEPPGCLEGGDVAWIDNRTLAVGRGYRTNDEGIAQLRTLLGGSIDLIVVPLPHWRGPDDVFHLMSMFSPVDRDLAVVHSPLLPVPFREQLLSRGIALVDVPDDEFQRMGTNVLAVAPRRCVMLSGHPVTRAKLERAGATVFEYEGSEISEKGGGGPTCLTRPMRRFNPREI